MTGGRRPDIRLLGTILALCTPLFLIAGCSSDTNHHGSGAGAKPSTAAPPPNEGDMLNATSVRQIIDRYRQAGLPATGPHDVTGSVCGHEHCQVAMATAETTVLAFKQTRDAMVYLQTHPADFQVENFVVSFAGSVNPSTRSQYEDVTTKAVE